MTLLARHAQSAWNLQFGAVRIDAGIPDPGLTAEGWEQATTLARSLAGERVARVITSPYRRTIETAMVVAERLGVPVTVEPLVRERCAFSCDQGTSPAALRTLWPRLDFTGLDEVWWGGMIESVETLRHRCRRFHAALAAMPDRDRVAIVTHWGFIRGMTGQEVANASYVRLAPSAVAR